MFNLKIQKASTAPKAAAILGAVLLKNGSKAHDSAMTKAGQELEQIAKANQKTLQGPLAPAMRKLRKAMTPPGSR